MDSIGRFQASGVLGSGAFGTVYEGVDPVSGDRVAVKVLDRMGGSADSVRAQLLAEAQALRSVDSSNTLRVIEVIDEGGVLALVTDFVVGASLRSVLDTHGQLNGQDALTVLYGAGLGLAAVHAAGLVHGDVKPANILVEPDGVSKLIDFGLVSLPGWISEDSASPWGSPAYAPPEQVTHEFRDQRSDIYSLTVTLFEVLCGQRPYVGETVEEVRANHVSQPVPDPRLWAPDLGDGLTQLVLWGLAKNPDERPQDVATWLQYLEAAATEKYGPGWATAASVGAVAGAVTAGGVVASGVLTAAAGSGAATGLGANLPIVISGGTAGSSSAGAAGIGAGVGAAKTGILATGLAKAVVAVAVVATIAAGGVVAKKTFFDDAAKTVPVAAVPAKSKVKMVEKIAFARCADGFDCTIFSVNPDGSDEREILEGNSPAWSPDGKKLAFIRSNESGSSVWVVDVADAGPQGSPHQILPIDEMGTHHSGLSWSPDGSTLGVSSSNGTGGSARTSTMALADKQLRTLSGNSFYAPSWSPDGKQMVYTFAPNGYEGADTKYVIGIKKDGGEVSAISDVETGDVNPFWSPKGDKISYDHQSEVWIMDTDGNRPAYVSAGSSAGWAPDGSTVMTQRCDESSMCSLYTVKIGTGVEAPVATGLHEFSTVSWGRTPARPDAVDASPTAAVPVQFDPELKLDGSGNIIGDSSKFDQLPDDVQADLQSFATSRANECGEASVSVNAYDPEGFILNYEGLDSDCNSGAAQLIWSKRETTWHSVWASNGVALCEELRAVRTPDSFGTFGVECYEHLGDVETVEYHRS